MKKQGIGFIMRIAGKDQALLINVVYKEKWVNTYAK